VSECDREESILRKPWSTGSCPAMEGGGGVEEYNMCMYIHINIYVCVCVSLLQFSEQYTRGL